MVGGTRKPRTRVRFGQIWIDSITFAGALDAIEQIIDRGEGGYVFTPNVDHVVLAEKIPAFRDAYAGVSLSLADGQPLVWTSRLVGAQLPAKISGSDLLWPLLERAAARSYRVYLLGGQPGAASAVAERVTRELGVTIVGHEAPRISVEPSPENDSLVARIRAARPHILLVALGSPKGELWIHRASPQLGSTVAFGIGAGLDFLAGFVRRAPAWTSRLGLEWLFRLGQEPRRLARRYLLEDPKFLGILYRTCRDPIDQRVQLTEPSAKAPI